MEITKAPLHRRLRGYLANANITKLCIGIVFIVLVLVPLVRMFFFITSENFSKAMSDSSFPTAVANSLTVTLVATLITLVMSYFLAVCISRTAIKFKGLFSAILVIPMLIPSISHGMSLKVLLGNNGIFTNLFGFTGSIYGFWGIVTGSVMYAFPVAFLMFTNIMNYEDYTQYEAAKILGIPRLRQFTQITFPYLRKPLISVAFSVFTMIITDYGVPLIIGGKYKTVPVILYQEVIGRLDFGKGAVYGTFLLIPAVVAFIFDVFNKDKGNQTFVVKSFELAKSGIAKASSYIYCIAVSLFALTPVIIFSIIGFTVKYPLNNSFTLKNITEAFGMNVGRYLTNSVVIACLVSLVGILVSFTCAYLTARMQSKMSRFLHLMSLTTAAIPGIVLGLSYIIVFKSTPLYGTLAIMVLVNLVHFFASPYIMMYNCMHKLNENLESVGQTLGISRLRMIRDVLLPQSLPTILEMASYFFVNCMMTISAVSFLANTSTKPVALMINQFEAQMQLEYAAIVSLAILLVNLLLKGIIAVVRHFLTRRSAEKISAANSAAAEEIN